MTSQGANAGGTEITQNEAIVSEDCRSNVSYGGVLTEWLCVTKL